MTVCLHIRYPATRKKATQQKKCGRIATLTLLEIGCASGVAFALKVYSPARNRLILGRYGHLKYLLCFGKYQGLEIL
jgi:hypothetical protein